MNFNSPQTGSVGKEDDDAASVDINDREQEPKEYVYPRYSMVNFCSIYLVTVHQHILMLKTYWRKLESEQFDRLLIFAR